MCKLTVKVSEQDWKTMILSHRPILCWEGNERGVILLHGHVHLSPNRNETCTNGDVQLMKVLDKSLCWDVGVDNNNYKPISLEEILDKINNKINGD